MNSLTFARARRGVALLAAAVPVAPVVSPKNAASATAWMLSPLRRGSASALRPPRLTRLKRCGYGYGMLTAYPLATSISRSGNPLEVESAAIRNTSAEVS